MMIPSGTPQGWSKDCPHCGAKVPIEPWAMFGDTTCVSCHTLLWFLHLEPQIRIYEHAASRPIRDRVIAFVAKQLGADPEKLAESAFSIEDLGTDSLNTIELVMKLEQLINLPD